MISDVARFLTSAYILGGVNGRIVSFRKRQSATLGRSDCESRVPIEQAEH
jgi:hypothetical protein